MILLTPSVILSWSHTRVAGFPFPFQSNPNNGLCETPIQNFVILSGANAQHSRSRRTRPLSIMDNQWRRRLPRQWPVRRLPWTGGSLNPSRTGLATQVLRPGSFDRPGQSKSSARLAQDDGSEKETFAEVSYRIAEAILAKLIPE